MSECAFEDSERGSWIPSRGREQPGCAAPDVAVEEGTFAGTHEGILHTPTGDIPPTGRAVSLEYIQVLRFRGGTRASFNLMFDRLAVLEQLGLIPAAASAG